MGKKVALLGVLGVFLTGCSNKAMQIRTQVAGELSMLVKAGDCQSTCEAVKAYVAEQVKNQGK